MSLQFFEPRISADTKPFWDGCREHKLVLPYCEKCHRALPITASICPHCLSSNLTHEEVEGTGKLNSFVVFRRPFHPSIKTEVPYMVVTVDLDCGVRILSNMQTVTDTLKPDDRLKCIFADYENYSKPIFIKEEGDIL